MKVNGVTEEISDYVDSAAIWKSVHMQPGRLSEGKLIDKNEKNDFDKKDVDIQSKEHEQNL